MLRPILVTLAVAAFVAAEDKKPAGPAAKPIERLSLPFWKNRHEKFLDQTKKGGIDVVFLGDSITQGWEGKGGKKAWDEAFRPLKAGNYGISGDQTGHVLWRITEGKELDGIDPKAAVIMIGTNNAGTHSAEQIAEGITAIVRELRRQKPNLKVLLLGVFPRANPREVKGDATAKQLNPKVKQVNEIIAKLDDGKAVFYKDIGGKFLDADGGLPRSVMPDLLHLSQKGYEIWAEAVKDDVAKLAK